MRCGIVTRTRPSFPGADDAVMALAPNTRIDHYAIAAPVGAGGTGIVYRARDTRLDREVAIEVLPGDFSADSDRLLRFEQEARATSALHHPNILAVHDVGRHEGAPYIVSELLEAEELRAQLTDGPLPLGTALDYASQIAAGLAAAPEVWRTVTLRRLIRPPAGRSVPFRASRNSLTQCCSVRGSMNSPIYAGAFVFDRSEARRELERAGVDRTV